MADTQERTIASARIVLGEDIGELGIMVAILTSDLELYKAADTANMTVLGRNEKVADEGEYLVAVPGKYLFDNSATYPVTNAYIGSDCYVEDEITVSTSGGSNSIVAGKVEEVVSEGVWVSVGLQ